MSFSIPKRRASPKKDQQVFLAFLAGRQLFGLRIEHRIAAHAIATGQTGNARKVTTTKNPHHRMPRFMDGDDRLIEGRNKGFRFAARDAAFKRFFEILLLDDCMLMTDRKEHRFIE